MSESTTTETVPSNVVRTADLTKAQMKVLVEVFGTIPDSKAITLQGRKGSVKTQPDCECGCGVDVPRTFKAGHDAQMKSLLNSLANGTETTQINHLQFSKASATAELAKRGW